MTPNQLEQVIEQSVAALVWTGKFQYMEFICCCKIIIILAGQLGGKQGGIDRMTAENQVTQILTKWRLNVSAMIAGQKLSETKLPTDQYDSSEHLLDLS